MTCTIIRKSRKKSADYRFLIVCGGVFSKIFANFSGTMGIDPLISDKSRTGRSCGLLNLLVFLTGFLEVLRSIIGSLYGINTATEASLFPCMDLPMGHLWQPIVKIIFN